MSGLLKTLVTTTTSTPSADWQYDLTVTGTNWTTTRAVGVVYKCASGQYRLRFNIRGTVSSASRTTYQIILDGVTFKNITNFIQPIIAYPDALVSLQSYCNYGNGNITINHSSATTTNYMFSGDVELESKPSWATNTL